MKTINDFTEEELKNMFIDCMPVIQLRNERNNYKQALNEIREYIYKNSIPLGLIQKIEEQRLDFEGDINDILQIIDKTNNLEKSRCIR